MIGVGLYAGARIPHGGFGPIEWVAGADSANVPTAGLLIPPHQAGDLIIAWAHSTVGSLPALPAGWTNILVSGVRVFSLNTRIYCIRDVANAVNTLALPGTTSDVGFMIYRNASGAGAAVMGAESTNMSGDISGTTPSLGSLNAGSWGIGGMDINQGDPPMGVPAALTARIRRDASLGGGIGSVCDTNGIVTSYAGGDVFTWVSPAIWAGFAFEILNG